jgi:hypothetical protein
MTATAPKNPNPIANEETKKEKSLTVAPVRAPQRCEAPTDSAQSAEEPEHVLERQ